MGNVCSISSTLTRAMSTAEDFSQATETGVSRLTLTDADRKARDWFRDTCESLGCKVIVDSMGTLIPSPLIAFSHLFPTCSPPLLKVADICHYLLENH